MRAGRLRWRFGRVVLTGAGWAGLLLGLAASIASAGDPARSAKGESRKASRAQSDDLDRMIQEAWASANLKPSRPAPDAEFCRRLYLDMLGRIPMVQETTAFLASKESGKRVKLVEYLLNDPDYAKNFANEWTLILIGRGNQGRQVNREALTGWLRRQFAENRPWNQAAYDLIAAKGSNKDNGAVNYTLAHLEFDAAPLTSITARVFLGQQIQCTQCHDHPMNDKWKQSHFWGINAFFKGVRRRDVMAPDATGAEAYDHTELFDVPTDRYSSFERRNGLFGVAFPTFLDGRKISQNADVDRRVELAKFITQKNDDFDKAFVNRMWAHFFRRGFVHPVDDFGDHNPPSHPELLAQMGADFRASGYDIKALMRRIATCQAYNLTSVTNGQNEKDDIYFSHMALKPMTPEQLFESLLVATSAQKAGGGGDNDRRRYAWLRQYITAFANDEGEETTSFQGTIPQALMMMNGDLMQKAVGGQTGSFLADLLDHARLQQRTAPDLYVIDHLYLAALGRHPSPAEVTRAREFLHSFPDTKEVVEDMFWALLNSNEFILNH